MSVSVGGGGAEVVVVVVVVVVVDVVRDSVGIVGTVGMW